jgi:hypothetical protein
MSQASAAAPQPLSNEAIPFEQQLYLRSPLGTLATTAIIFVFLFGSFLALAALNHVPTIWRAPNGIAISGAAWPALVLSLLCCAALSMQRYARVWEANDAPAFARILTGGAASAARVTGLRPRDLNLVRSTIIGIAIGLILSAAVMTSESREGHPIEPGPFVWYICAITFLNILFVRGVAQTRAADKSFASMLSTELKIDLLRIDRLAVLGRSAARSSLIWFVVSAVACLFFVGGDLNGFTVALIASCAVIGIGLFIGTMSRVHRQILAAKHAELEHIRSQIDSMRATMQEDSGVAARMHGMLAYETRIADAHEWPFDQSTLVRVGASALILTVPWFGQAAVQYFIDRLGH